MQSARTTSPSTSPVIRARRVVEQDRGVADRAHSARRSLMSRSVPEQLVLEGDARRRRAAAGQAGDPLRHDRVPLVGHRRAALLPAAEGLHELADLRVLQVAHLGGEALQRAAGDRDGREDGGVSVALDDLRAHRVDGQVEVGKDLGLEVGREVAVGAHRAGDLAGGRLVEGAGEAYPVAVELERPACELARASSARRGPSGSGPS